MKSRFYPVGSLKYQQAISLFEKIVGIELDTDSKSQLSNMTNLTAGDFAILARRLRFKSKNVGSEEELGILEVESDLKTSKRRIGF